MANKGELGCQHGDEDLDGHSHVLHTWRAQHYSSTGQLVFNVPLHLFGFCLGPGICRTSLAAFANNPPAMALSAIASLGELIACILAALRMPDKIVMVGVLVIESCSLIAPTRHS